MEKPYRLNASIIAHKDGKYLLVKKPREQHAWQFPQGGVEEGEDFREAALREFTEELGTDQIEILGEERAVYHYDWPEGEELSDYLKEFRGQEVHIFLADFTGDEPSIQLDTDELAEYRFVDSEELESLLESPDYLKTVQTIINGND